MCVKIDLDIRKWRAPCFQPEGRAAPQKTAEPLLQSRNSRTVRVKQIVHRDPGIDRTYGSFSGRLLKKAQIAVIPGPERSEGTRNP
jgi:hypothetical protein